MDYTDSLGFGDTLHDPPNATVDIVFVHGLGGHRINTWTSPSTDETPTSTFWPKDLLPKACKTARILSYGYNSKFIHFFPRHGPREVWKSETLDDYSAMLLQDLSCHRILSDTPDDRPIIFIAHSLGGLVVANAISRPHVVEIELKNITDNTAGVIFMGTPFEGSEKARWGAAGLRILQWIGQTKKEDVRDLKKRSAKLSMVNEVFYRFMRARNCDHTKIQLDFVCYYEEHPTFVAGKSIGLIVERGSASLGGIDSFPIEANHSGMCKFPGEYASGYVSITERLKQWMAAIDEYQMSKKGGQQAYHSVTLGNINFQQPIHGVVAASVISHARNGVTISGTIVYNQYYGNQLPPKRSDERGGVLE